MISVNMKYGGTRQTEEAASSGGGGGGISFTRLWTNNSPSSSFAAQSVSLASAASSYQYIRIVWERVNTAGVTDANWETSSDALAYLYDMRNASSLLDATHTMQMGASVRPGTGYYSRRCWFTSTACTSIEFGATTRWAQSGTNNSLLVPVLIDGVSIT